MIMKNCRNFSQDVNNPLKFQEAHFHFRYVDYPCYDVTFAQFL